MFSFLDVRCPHCGVQGRIVLPPLGTILIGPCPKCKGIVALFNGITLPLNNKILMEGTIDQKKKHILEVFNQYFEERINEFFSPESKKKEENDYYEEIGEKYLSEYKVDDSPKAVKQRPITKEELLRFIETEIDTINNPEVFKKYFRN